MSRTPGKLATLAICFATLPLAALPAAADEGPALYEARCAACHDHPQTGIPPRAQLASRSLEFIMEKLLLGSMQTQTLGLSEAQIKELALFLTQLASQTAPPCPDAPPAAGLTNAH